MFSKSHSRSQRSSGITMVASEPSGNNKRQVRLQGLVGGKKKPKKVSLVDPISDQSEDIPLNNESDFERAGSKPSSPALPRLSQRNTPNDMYHFMKPFSTVNNGDDKTSEKPPHAKVRFPESEVGPLTPSPDGVDDDDDDVPLPKQVYRRTPVPENLGDIPVEDDVLIDGEPSKSLSPKVGQRASDDVKPVKHNEYEMTRTEDTGYTSPKRSPERTDTIFTQNHHVKTPTPEPIDVAHSKHATPRQSPIAEANSKPSSPKSIVEPASRKQSPQPVEELSSRKPSPDPIDEPSNRKPSPDPIDESTSRKQSPTVQTSRPASLKSKSSPKPSSKPPSPIPNPDGALDPNHLKTPSNLASPVDDAVNTRMPSVLSGHGSPPLAKLDKTVDEDVGAGDNFKVTPPSRGNSGEPLKTAETVEHTHVGTAGETSTHDTELLAQAMGDLDFNSTLKTEAERHDVVTSHSEQITNGHDHTHQPTNSSDLAPVDDSYFDPLSTSWKKIHGNEKEGKEEENETENPSGKENEKNEAEEEEGE